MNSSIIYTINCEKFYWMDDYSRLRLIGANHMWTGLELIANTSHKYIHKINLFKRNTFCVGFQWNFNWIKNYINQWISGRKKYRKAIKQ